MAKVLIATDKPFAKMAVSGIKEIIEDSGLELVMLEKYTSKEQLKEAIANVEAVIIRSDIIDREVIESGKNLKIVVRAGAGYDNVDLDAATEKGVVVMNTPGQNANAVAELAFGMMIHLIRNGFNGSSGFELRNKKLGIHGYGHIGRIVNLIGKGFGMKVYAYDPFVDKVLIENDGVKVAESVDELYEKCQYISVNLPANDKTRNMLNYQLLSKMPENPVLVNTARKEIVNEAELIILFEQRNDFRYTSDIAPDCKCTLEEKFPGRTFFTVKKMGAQTEEANTNAGLAAARQIISFLKNGDSTFQVNK